MSTDIRERAKEAMEFAERNLLLLENPKTFIVTNIVTK